MFQFHGFIVLLNMLVIKVIVKCILITRFPSHFIYRRHICFVDVFNHLPVRWMFFFELDWYYFFRVKPKAELEILKLKHMYFFFFLIFLFSLFCVLHNRSNLKQCEIQWNILSFIQIRRFKNLLQNITIIKYGVNLLLMFVSVQIIQKA